VKLYNFKVQLFPMEKYKVNSPGDNQKFVTTRSYEKLYKTLKKLKKKKGKILHIVGAPGTGKSTNMYHALNELDLKVYDVKFEISRADTSPKEVFKSVYNLLRNDLQLKSKKDLYKQLSQFDVVLIADSFHDSHLTNSEVVGFSQWSDTAGFRALPFYLLCIREYLRNRKKFKKINLVLQTAWRVYIKGKKYDLFSDLGILSRILVFLLQRMFTVVEISYSQEETIKIVKIHLPHGDEELIYGYIKKYGYKPRFICDALDSEI
jgi:hypothetical protein